MRVVSPHLPGNEPLQWFALEERVLSGQIGRNVALVIQCSEAKRQELLLRMIGDRLAVKEGNWLEFAHSSPQAAGGAPSGAMRPVLENA